MRCAECEHYLSSNEWGEVFCASCGYELPHADTNSTGPKNQNPPPPNAAPVKPAKDSLIKWHFAYILTIVAFSMYILGGR